MSGEDKPDPDFAAASTWELRHRSAADDCADHSYFFATDDDYKESSILSEFGWNIPADSSGASNRDGGFADFPPIEPDLAASRADDYVAPDVISSSTIEPMVDASASNPSVSSSSSDDPPEKSAAANPPPEAA